MLCLLSSSDVLILVLLLLAGFSFLLSQILDVEFDYNCCWLYFFREHYFATIIHKRVLYRHDCKMSFKSFPLGVAASDYNTIATLFRKVYI